MAKINFTADRVANFQCDPGKQQSIFWDAKTPGLGLRVTAGGAKSYIFETRLNGKTLRITIGDVRTWTVAKAQAEATHHKAQTDKGSDPRELRAEQQAKAEATRAEAKRHDLTLGDVWPLYLAARKPRWGERHYQDHVNLAAEGGQPKKRGKGETVAGPLAPLMPLRLSELTPTRIAEWLEAEAAARPTNAAQSFRKLRALIRWADNMPAYHGIIPSQAYSASNVRDVLPANRTKDGDSLQREQLQDWFAAVRKIPNPTINYYLQGLLLTGARRDELAGLRWAEVDFQWRSLSIRDKVEGTRTIPLTPYFASLLVELKRINETPPNVRQVRKLDAAGKEWAPSPWVFSSSTAASGRLVEPRIAHTNALEAAGLPHVSLHGLRRSFGTLCEWVEVPSGVSAQIMGHKPSALAEKHYRRRPIDMLRKWHDQIEVWMLEQAGIEFKPAPAGLRVVAAS
ncbi:tyrosine-type recombinase/integrase [Pseudoduganella namucuonensis]|uniref:Phage integrase family protein n=1 Tax=Pseudoduganella namucuonensis TaxID=1035707 RepID=A0A1I7K905_9BURK|nr:integrase family protein [Pseudoduganella namucuonensis]SFU93907.1 Phage integrase family protein [Pseudoduganella namucuonensis]